MQTCQCGKSCRPCLNCVQCAHIYKEMTVTIRVHQSYSERPSAEDCQESTGARSTTWQLFINTYLSVPPPPVVAPRGWRCTTCVYCAIAPSPILENEPLPIGQCEEGRQRGKTHKQPSKCRQEQAPEGRPKLCREVDGLGLRPPSPKGRALRAPRRKRHWSAVRLREACAAMTSAAQ